MKSIGTKRLGSGFTLVELLVVIAIVAILAILLFTVASRVKENAQATKCVHNLKQVGVAISAYSNDFKGRILPRYADDVPAGDPKGWPFRLLKFGYLGNPDVLFCPSFFPRNNKEASSLRKPAERDASETYGMRDWIVPGVKFDLSNLRSHKPLAVIREPSDFFLVADSYWSAAGWNSQGYGISPAVGGVSEQSVHLRHQKMANALFADGHVEPKPESYFLKLCDSDRQADYTASSTFRFSVITP